KAMDKYGMRLEIEGEIKSANGETVANFKSMHDGMGIFPIIPMHSATYFATINGSAEQYPLPQSTDNGVAFSVRNSPRGKQFQIHSTGTSPAFKPAYLVGQMENEVIFKHPLNSEKNEIIGVIPTEGFYSGILHITVFNKDDMPLAERITFIDNREYILPATVTIDSLDTGPRKRNRFSIALPDTVVGNFSVSVIDADSEDAANRSQNIYSWFLLNSDIKGYVHNPAYYFSSADTIGATLDLVMMTNGWTRFKWTEVAQQKLPQPQYKDHGYIELNGQVMIEGTKKPLANRDIITMRSPVDTSQGRRSAPQLIQTDSSGYFKMDSMVFSDRQKILFSEVKGNKSKDIRVKLNADSLNRKFSVEPVFMPLDSVLAEKNGVLASAYDDYMKAQGLLLENVVVKVRQKSQMELLDEQYASGLFSGGINSRTIDLRDEAYGGDIFQY